MKELDKAYSPEGIEQKWYALWEEKGYFRPDVLSRGSFSIVIPPPNVTGTLHMGHALNATLQDVLTRWKRMLGFRTLWLPGTDHAGIATQNVVERELSREGTDRHKIGREAFVERIWKWKGEYGGRIIHQLKRLGASCDWSRERFTLDEGLSRAVREVFVRLYEEGLIYRDNRLINWCPRCHTALSDLEVEHEEIDGRLTHIRYPFADGKDVIVVATTRPETMLGDTAVAVNPDDERYREQIGKTITLPLTGRTIPLIADSAVDPSFGTGAVKVTPSHDFNDESMARRQNPPLPFVTVIDGDGKMTGEAGERYAGLDRYECRKLVAEDLKAAGLIEKEETYRHSVGHCYRCRTIIEPLATPQWYVGVKPLAGAAIAAVRDGRIRIIPRNWENTYFPWMENIKDWCVSRQIWWGHRIPVWYCDACGETIVARETPERCTRCAGAALRQDEDVLDTWFSSALWPFSTLGWPDTTEDLAVFYPTSVLVTAFDILFFWVARMIMMGLKFMGEVPFHDVYIHALVRDAHGQKMSKSKGNVVDPLIMIDKYGADAFRFSLAAFAGQGRDIRFSEDRVEGYRYFVNKLWNASRFVLMNINALDGDEILAVKDEVRRMISGSPAEGKALASRWIISRLAATADEMNAALQDYRFNDAASSLYQFIWHEFCDWYVEMSKESLYAEGADKAKTLACLLSVLEASLRLMHPFMPFVTEELWQILKEYFPEPEESIVLAAFPKDLRRDPDAEQRASLVIGAVAGVRSVRGEMNISPALEVKALIKVFEESVEQTVKGNLTMIERLAKAKEIHVGRDVERPKGSATAVRDAFEIYVPLEGLLDIQSEIERLTKERRKLEESLGFLAKKLSNQDFLRRAPQEVIEKERAKYEELTQRDERLKQTVNRLQEAEVKHG